MKVKEKILRRIPFPAVRFERPSELGKDIAAFYNALRQHPDEEIDVRDIVINRARAEEILLRLTRHEEVKTLDDRFSIHFFWLNYGPSSDPDVPYDEVWVRGYDVC